MANKPTTLTTADFLSIQKDFDDFRNQCFGENMTQIWEDLFHLYIPNNTTLRAMVQYSVSGNRVTDETLLSAAQATGNLFNFDDPIVATKLQTALSLLTQRTPDVLWKARDKYKAKIPLLNALRARDWQDEETRLQYQLFWFFNILTGTTFWRRYFYFEEREVKLPKSIDLATKKIKYQTKTIRRGDITRGEALSPLQVWIDPATSPLSPSSMRKVIYRKIYTEDEFTRRFGELPDYDITDVSFTAIEGYSGTKNVEVFFFENMDDDYYGVFTRSKEKAIHEGPLPFNHKELSVQMSVWFPRSEKNPFGLGPIELMREDKEALNEFKNLTLTQAKLSILKPGFTQTPIKSESSANVIKLEAGVMYQTSEKPTFLDIPAAGSEAWKSMDYLRSRVDDASGITRPLEGGLTSNSTAFQTDLAKDAALSRMSVPIQNVVSLLSRDAKLGYELQKQYLSLPVLKEITKDEESKFKDELAQLALEGKEPTFDIWIDDEHLTKEGEPKVFRGDYKVIDLALKKSTEGDYSASESSMEVTLTPDVFEWEGDAFVVADSILTITPTLDRIRDLEMMNLLIPLFGKPPELVAKAAENICQLYSKDPKEILPESFIQYLDSLASGVPLPPPPEEQGNPPGRPREFGPQARKAMDAAQNGANQFSFQQERAPKVVTGFNGANSAVASRSQAINQTT